MSRTIVYSSPFIPAEWLACHGFKPLRLVPDVAPAAVSQGVCPFAAAFAQSVFARGDPTVLTTTCDQMRRISEQIATKSSTPLFLMNVPATWQTQTAREIYKDDLRRMSRWMIDIGGKPQSPLPRYSGGGPGWADEKASVLGRRPSFRFCGTCKEALYLRHFRQAQQNADEVAGSVFISPGPGWGQAPAGIPIALIGGPLRRQDFWIHDHIGECGGRVALDATEEGERATAHELDGDRFAADPIEELTRTYFDHIPDAFRRPDTLLHEYLSRELIERSIRGILLIRFLWCDQWHAQLGRLRVSTKLPIVEIDLGGEDHSIQRTRNRIEALLNILK